MMPPPSPTPTMPGTPAGSPPHPGSSPITAPGAGAGNEAAAVSQVKASLDALYKALPALPHGGDKAKAVLAAIQALNKIFAGDEGKSTVPAAIQQMMGAAKSGSPLANAPAPGLANAPTEPPKMAA